MAKLDDLVAEILALPEAERQELARSLLSLEQSLAVGEAAAGYLSSNPKAMKSVLVSLPDDLVSEASAAGLLTDKQLESLIRRALREQGVGAREGRRHDGRPLQLPVYRGKSGLADGIDPRSNQSLLDAAGDDT